MYIATEDHVYDGLIDELTNGDDIRIIVCKYDRWSHIFLVSIGRYTDWQIKVCDWGSVEIEYLWTVLRKVKGDVVESLQHSCYESNEIFEILYGLEKHLGEIPAECWKVWADAKETETLGRLR